MMTTAVFNGTLGFVMLLTLCFCLGDVELVLDSPVGRAGVPFIMIFSQGVQSNIGASVMASIVIILSTFCCISNIATASRQLFAFARDKGLPFSRFFAFVSLFTSSKIC
jgi:amino acid transporter